jgi:hypothetical protein
MSRMGGDLLFPVVGGAIVSVIVFILVRWREPKPKVGLSYVQYREIAKAITGQPSEVVTFDSLHPSRAVEVDADRYRQMGSHRAERLEVIRRDLYYVCVGSGMSDYDARQAAWPPAPMVVGHDVGCNCARCGEAWLRDKNLPAMLYWKEYAKRS